jgi:hypothetical protein
MAVSLVRVGAVYLISGVLLGMAMHHQHSRALMGAHAHVTLAGGFLTIIFGLVYRQFPQAGQSRLAAVHFWTHNLAFLALFAFTGYFSVAGRSFDDAQPHTAGVLFATIAMAVVTSLIVFAVNVFRNVSVPK